MKIQQLRFKNLNSLEGEWLIDFTAPEFESEGIFVITGPTGVGKTTILDAICLALYGSTPRLKKITASSNDIMSRQTGECFAELTFSTMHGAFRCHWSQRRAHNNANGNLQPAKHEISKADGDKKVIERQLNAVQRKVEEVTGMDFDRFTRSVMLAQGNFAKFLQSSANERAPILEQITGTAIYSELSILVHQRKTNAQQRFDEHQIRINEIQILDDEVLQELKNQQSELTPQLEKKDTEFKKLQSAEQWILKIKKEIESISSLEEKQQSHRQALADFLPKSQKLALAEKAYSIEVPYNELLTLQKNHQSLRDDLSNLAKEILSQKKTAQSAQEKSDRAKESLASAKKSQKDKEPKIIEARNLTTTNDALQSQLKESLSEQKKLTAEQTSIQSEVKTTSEALSKLEAEIVESLAFCDEYGYCAPLVTELSGIRERASQWENLLDQQKRAANAVEVQTKTIVDLTANLEMATKAHKQAELSLAEIKNAHREAKKNLSNLLDGESKKSLDEKLSLLRKQLRLEEKIFSLEDERTKLIQGESCPLCGSKEHPYAEQRPPSPSETERSISQLEEQLDSVENQEKNLNQLFIQIEKNISLVTSSQEKVTQLQSQRTKEKKSLEQEKSHLEELTGKTNETHRSLSHTVTSFFPKNPPNLTPESISSTLTKLKNLKQQWEKHSGVIEKNVEEKTKLTAILSEKKEHLVKLTDKIEELTNKIKSLQNSIAINQKSIDKLIGKTSPNALAASLQKAIDTAEATFVECNQSREKAHGKLLELKAKQTDTEKREEEIARNLQNHNQLFLEELKKNDFSDLDAYRAARLDPSSRHALQTEKKQLEAKENELKTLLDDAKEKLKKEKEKNLTTDPLEKIQESIKSLNEEHTAISKQLGVIHEKLEQNDNRRQQLKEQLAEKEKLEKELARWSKLHGLIGSADGKKFRNFAQGLTFEIMVQHANDQLKKMSERYLLVRDENSPLDLNVIDFHQAGEIRSTKNLSGGESFIISLSLALGLSRMASRNVQIDSLFLDEGFGTLDEASLETALSNLASLNNDGKLIGIISHISALKERIPTQLNLIPTLQGKARITGPGVSP